MENFDFNAPVLATIIYEDDESIEESIDIRPILQENDQGEDIISSKSKTPEKTIETKTAYVGLDAPTNNSDSVVKIGQSVGICAQTDTETDSATPTSPPKLLDMPSLEDCSIISKYFNIKNNSDDKIENKSTREDFKKYVNVELVDFIKERKRKINDTKEISAKVLETKINNEKNKISQNVSAHNKELIKILHSDKISSNNDKRETETSLKKIKISQEILTVKTSARKTSTDGDTDTNCIQTLNAINYKNGSDPILYSENQEDNKKSKNVYSNEPVSKSNDGPSMGIHETHSVSENNYTTNIEIQTILTEQITDQTQNNLLINSTPNETVDIVKKLLDTVSEHLIFIMSAYQSYGKVCSSNADLNMKEKARTYYTYTKNRLFDLSYSSVVYIILPRKDNTAFVESFLKNTMQIAKSKSLNCSYKYIEMLYLEMIQWVQRRQKQLFQNTNSNPIINATLKAMEKMSQSAGGQETQSGKKQRLSSYSMQNSHPNSITQYQVSYAQPGHIQPQIQNAVAYRGPPPPYQSQGNQMMQASLLHHGYSLPYQPTRHLQPNTQPLYTAGVNARPLYSENAYMMQHTQSMRNTILTNPPLHDRNMNLPTASESLHSTVSTQVQYTAYSKQNQANELNTKHPSITLSRDFRTQHLEANPSRNTTTPQLQPENAVQTDCSRSSISRDSGFISPLNFQSNNSLLPGESSPSLTTTPLITHVTSLNPNATLSKDGPCKVCGKVTKQKCIGCYNIYYCSHICQHWDWTSHQLSCRYATA